MGALGIGTHYYQRSQFPVSSPPNMLMLTLEVAGEQLARLCSSPSHIGDSPPGDPQTFTALGFISFCFKKQPERYRATEPVPRMGGRDVIPHGGRSLELPKEAKALHAFLP